MPMPPSSFDHAILRQPGLNEKGGTPVIFESAALLEGGGAALVGSHQHGNPNGCAMLARPKRKLQGNAFSLLKNVHRLISLTQRESSCLLCQLRDLKWEKRKKEKHLRKKKARWFLPFERWRSWDLNSDLVGVPTVDDWLLFVCAIAVPESRGQSRNSVSSVA